MTPNFRATGPFISIRLNSAGRDERGEKQAELIRGAGDPMFGGEAGGWSPRVQGSHINLWIILLAVRMEPKLKRV